MKDIVIGLGETGQPLFDVLKKAYPDTIGFDINKHPSQSMMVEPINRMNICIPYSDRFIKTVTDYQKAFQAKLTIIHSTVPIGTTIQIPDAVHSPILGMHNDMEKALTKFYKWIGGQGASLAAKYFEKAGMACHVVQTSNETEALKLMCLAKYGMSIAFAQYQKGICDKWGFDYADVLRWDDNYNNGVKSTHIRPLLNPPGDIIGGHCVIPGTKLLYDQQPSPILEEVLKFAEEQKHYQAWQPSKVYPTAKIGKNVNIGSFSEIGNNVVIGDNVRIGAMCFIPEGVTIEDDAWIGPRATFTNDLYPPSGKEDWKPTVVKKGARLGAAVTVLPGVTIGQEALIGAGSVVTQDIPKGTIAMGIPAKWNEQVLEGAG